MSIRYRAFVAVVMLLLTAACDGGNPIVPIVKPPVATMDTLTIRVGVTDYSQEVRAAEIINAAELWIGSTTYPLLVGQDVVAILPKNRPAEVWQIRPKVGTNEVWPAKTKLTIRPTTGIHDIFVHSRNYLVDDGEYEGELLPTRVGENCHLEPGQDYSYWPKIFCEGESPILGYPTKLWFDPNPAEVPSGPDRISRELKAQAWAKVQKAARAIYGKGEWFALSESSGGSTRVYLGFRPSGVARGNCWATSSGWGCVVADALLFNLYHEIVHILLKNPGFFGHKAQLPLTQMAAPGFEDYVIRGDEYSREDVVDTRTMVEWLRRKQELEQKGASILLGLGEVLYADLYP